MNAGGHAGHLVHDQNLNFFEVKMIAARDEKISAVGHRFEMIDPVPGKEGARVKF